MTQSASVMTPERRKVKRVDTDRRKVARKGGTFSDTERGQYFHWFSFLKEKGKLDFTDVKKQRFFFTLTLKISLPSTNVQKELINTFRLAWKCDLYFDKKRGSVKMTGIH